MSTIKIPVSKLVLCLGVAGLLGCGEPAAAPPVEPERKVPWVEDGVVHLPSAFRERIGLQLSDVKQSELEPVVTVTGVVGFDEQRVAAIGSRISGRVHSVLVVPGDRVEAGKELGRVETTELGTAQSEVISARAKLAAADSQAQRRQRLRQEGIASQVSVEEAVRDLKMAKAELLAAEQKVKALAGPDGPAGFGLAALRSPIKGEVVEVHVSRGQAIEPTHTAFRVADLDQVWVKLAVFEGELAGIHIGDEVELTPQTRADQVLRGVVSYVGSVLDPSTRTASVRVVVDNAQRHLRIGETVRGKIRAEQRSRQALAVPRDAVLRVDGEPQVFVAIDENRLVPRKVTLGSESPTHFEIADGLKPGEKIVTKGAFEIKSEMFR